MKKKLERPHDPMEDYDDETHEYNPPPHKNLSRSVRRHYSQIKKEKAERLGRDPIEADHLASHKRKGNFKKWWDDMVQRKLKRKMPIVDEE